MQAFLKRLQQCDKKKCHALAVASVPSQKTCFILVKNVTVVVKGALPTSSSLVVRSSSHVLQPHFTLHQKGTSELHLEQVAVSLVVTSHFVTSSTQNFSVVYFCTADWVL